MTKLDALEALLEKVRAGDEYIEKDIQDVWGGWRDNPASRYAMKVHATGSLDAALSLHQAVASPHYVIHRIGQRYGGAWDAVILEIGEDGWHDHRNNKRFEVFADDPARAWLMAILQALIAQERRE